MSIITVLILAVVQGVAELLPVSSSAHVIVVEKLLGLDPTAPAMTFLLVMLHTGTMFAVLAYFWNRWRKRLSRSNAQRGVFVRMLVAATAATGILGLGLQWVIEKLVLGGGSHAAVEDIFGNTALIGISLAAVGALIIVSGRLGSRREEQPEAASLVASSFIVGIVQGLSLPFRGFSRSGSTISTAILRGFPKDFAEEFSFFLAAILTIPVVGRETLRLRASAPASGPAGAMPWLLGGCGLVFSFAAGFFAIRWLSAWLERGRWAWFGVYCLVLAAALLSLRFAGVLV
jgi:undecaprenyl-diphosphatase